MKFRWLPIGLFSLLLSSCTTIILVRSSWNYHNIVIDGKDKDWEERTFFLNDQNLSLGVTNDSSTLYLYVKAVDKQQVRHIRMAGLTIWLDPGGGDDKVFGIRIPGKPVRPGETMEGEFENPDDNIDAIEILQHGDDHPIRVPLAQLKGIQIGHSTDNSGSMFEFGIPLHITIEGVAPVNLASTEVGIGIEGGKFAIQRPKGEGGRDQGLESGGEDQGQDEGMGQEEGFGRRRAEGRSRENMSGGKRNEPIDFWFKSKLAQGKP